MTSQCFCMNSTPGRLGFIAMWCTQCPISASWSGIYCERSPRLIGFQVLPPSSVRKAPAAEMAIQIRCGLLGSRMMVCRHMPPARGCLAGGRSRLVPGLSAIVGALNDLPEPTARLRSVYAIGIGERSLDVIHLPARKMGATDVPFFTLAV